MANTILTNLTAITSAAVGDKIYICDISDTTDSAAGSSRQITIANLFTNTTFEGTAVFNEAGADVDFRVESDTDANAIFVEGSNGKVGFGTATPAEKLNVIGNFQVDDADTATKGYRFRTTGSDLDLDGSGRSLLLSVYSDADFAGTQRTYMKFFAAQNTAQMFLAWEIQKTGGTTVIEWDPNVGAGGDLFVINQAGENKDTRIEGDTDADLIHVDASSDRVGIGVAAPVAKLDVNGDINTTAAGNIIVAGVDPTRAFYIPASAFTAATTNGAASGTIETATNKVIMPVFDFDTTTQEFVAIAIPSPHFWDASTITVQFIWTAASGSGGVVWAAQGVAFSDDDALDTAYGTEQIIADTLITAVDDHHTSFTPAITIAGTPVAGDLVCLRFKRNVADGGDTIAVDCRLIGVKVRFGISQYNDA